MKKRIFGFFTAFAIAIICSMGCQANIFAADTDKTHTEQFLYQYNDTYQGLELTKYLGKDSEVTIPAKIDKIPVTVIGAECFSKNTNLTKLTLPDTIVSIGERAFWGCYVLEKVIFSENIKSIGSEAFSSCNLTSVSLPDSLTYLGESAFALCKSLKEVICSEGLTELNGTFQGCHNLKIVKLPSSSQFTKIGKHTFYGCPIKKFEIPASVAEIDSYAFGNGLIKLTFSKNSGLKKINDYAFAGCAFEKITLPASLEEMGSKVFDNCDRLKKIFFEKNAKINKIPNKAFTNCLLLQEVDIPENVTEIGASLFSCTIRKINIKGGNLKKIDKKAFQRLYSRGTITVPKKYQKKYTRMFQKQKWYKKTMKIKAAKKA